MFVESNDDFTRIVDNIEREIPFEHIIVVLIGRHFFKPYSAVYLIEPLLGDLEVVLAQQLLQYGSNLAVVVIFDGDGEGHFFGDFIKPVVDLVAVVGIPYG